MTTTSLSAPRRLTRKVTQLYVGLAVYGFGIGLAVEAGLGLSPWDVLHQGLSRLIGLTIGAWVIIIGLAVMLLWIPLRQRPGFGTISNVIFLGLFADLAIWLLPTPEGWAAQWAFLLSGLVLEAAATAMYIGAAMGPGPRDGLMTGLAARGWSIRLARTVIELTALASGWLMGGTAGLGTIVFALGIGPLTQFFMPIFKLRDPRQ